MEEGVERPDGAGLGEGRVREGAARCGGEAGATVGGDDEVEQLLAGTEVRGGGEAREDGLHGREEARGGELGDDEVVAAEGVAKRCGGLGGGGRRVEEEAQRGVGVPLAAEGGGEVVGRELLPRHGGRGDLSRGPRIGGHVKAVAHPYTGFSGKGPSRFENSIGPSPAFSSGLIRL